MRCHFNPRSLRNLRTWVGLRRMPVSFSIRSHASAIVQTGASSNDARIMSRKAANSLTAFRTLECRSPSNPPLQYASTYRCTVARDTPTISAAFWRATPQCRSQIVSILFRTSRLGWLARSSLTIRRSSSVRWIRHQAIVRLPALQTRSKTSLPSSTLVYQNFRKGGMSHSVPCGVYDGTIEIPSATVWNTSHQLAITENLRDAVCDQMSNRSAGTSCADVCQSAGDENLLGRSTVIDIVHQEGEQLIVAQRERARAVLDGASEAQLALLGPAVVDPDAVTGFGDDDLPLDDSEEAQAEWEQVQAEWIATGFPGCEPAFAVAKAEGLWLQVSVLLLQLGVLSGERRLLLLGDGAAWIRAWRNTTTGR